ncbi:Transglutaminase-like enzyme, putative cysteine protease [Oribacterium sp. KHPX15]|uniref:transglutaminase-like domain-containing protein n=1 Tax=Oribacterium sp. KHPX15 TaxID=1855342 RepID=UPI00089D40DB|nr:transglutaminase-like domain-containing protein [Oribacterium sp. KHPX15]SEA93430.1 Transglutaminase-like enzyme, putative cysteine protease [Oribacterium sp. KHPX15]
MKKKIKRVVVSGMIATMLAQSFTGNAANWTKINNEWNYILDDGTMAKGWRWIDADNNGIGECYYFDTDGKLFLQGKTPDGYDTNSNGAWTENGTIKTKEGSWCTWPDTTGASHWYYLCPDGTFAVNTWKLLDGNHDGISEFYCFDNNGQMYAGTLTPDGLQVNSDGKRLNEDGSIAIVETPETKKMAETGLAKGLTGGGSSSGGGGGSSSGGGGSSRGSSSSGSSSSGSSTKEVEASKTEYSTSDAVPLLNTDTTSQTSDDSASSEKESAEESQTKSVQGQGIAITSGYTIADYVYGSKKSDLVTKEQQKAVDKKIQQFKDKYIRGGESDCLKVILICRYLTKNVSYDADYGTTTLYKTAYDALVKGTAQCMGYADAFLQMADAVGLETRYVYNGNESDLHVFNLVRVEGEWMMVDPTNAFLLSDPTELYNGCVLFNESALDEYGYIDDETVPPTVCYGTPETRFAYKGAEKTQDIQTADGELSLVGYSKTRDYLDRLKIEYGLVEEEADEVFTIFKNDDYNKSEKIAKKILSSKDKKIGILWDQTTYHEAENMAEAIEQLVKDKGYKVSYDALVIDDADKVYNTEKEDFDYNSFVFRSVFKLGEKITAESEEEDDNISTPSELEKN